MQVLETILIVFFIIVAILLILIILLQSNRSSGMGIFGGGSQSAFGSSSADVLTKMTSIFAGIFLVLAMVLAYIRSTSGNIKDVQEELNKDNATMEKTTDMKTDKTDNKGTEDAQPSASGTEEKGNN